MSVPSFYTKRKLNNLYFPEGFTIRNNLDPLTSIMNWNGDPLLHFVLSGTAPNDYIAVFREGH